MRNNLIRLLNFPKKTIINRNLPKKLFFKQGNFSTTDRSIFISDIETIYLLSTMNTLLTNIPSKINDEFRYEEVDWIYIRLRSTKQLKKIDILLHKTLPNALCCIYENQNGELLFSVALKRLSKQNVTKIVIEKVILTEWLAIDSLTSEHPFIKSLQYDNLSKTNILTLYKDLEKALNRAQSIQLIGRYVGDKGTERLDDLLNQIKNTTKHIEQLHNKQSSLLDFGEKMKIYIKIQKYQQQIEQLKQQLREMN